MKYITGKAFGNLEVLQFDCKKKGHDYYLCKCNLCGKILSLRGSNLTYGLQISCGCRKKKGITHEIRKDKANINNKMSDIKGVCFIAGKWTAYIYHSHKQYILLTSESEKECIAARKAAEMHINDEDFEAWYQSFRAYIAEAKNKDK